MWVWQGKGGCSVGHLGQVLGAVVVGTPWAATAAARVKFCISAGSEVWKLVWLKISFCCLGSFYRNSWSGCACLCRNLWWHSWGWAGRLGGVGVGLALVATQECCWGCTCETVPRHLTWSGSLPAQLKRCSQVLSSAPWFLIEFYRENGISLAGARVKPAMRQIIS